MEKKKISVIGKISNSASFNICVINFEKLLPKEKYLFTYFDIFNEYKNINKIFNDKNFIDSEVVLLIRDIIPDDIILRFSNKLFIYILDDDLLNLYELGNEYKEYATFCPGSKLYLDLENILKKANIVLTFSNKIISSVQKYNKNIVRINTNILSEHITGDNGSFHFPKKIVSLSSGSRRKEFALISNDLKKISEKFKKNVEFYFYGYCLPNIKEVIGHSDVKCFKHNNDYNDYIKIIKNEQFDFLLSPLLDEGSKTGKSNVKLIDACLCNAIGIFSNSFVYENVVHMENGIKIKDDKSWFDGIENALNLSPADRDKILNGAKETVLKKYTTEKYLDIFANMLDGNLYIDNSNKKTYSGGEITANEFLGTEKIFYNNINTLPLVSVILPTYCRGNNGFLIRSINSVLSQTFKNFELIIVDDGSIDNTQEIIKDFMKIDNRIVYIRNEINSGLPAIRVNQGIRIARAKYIAYQFDDDVWVNDALEVLYNGIINNFSFAYSKSLFVHAVSGEKVVFGQNFDYKLLSRHNIITNNTVMHEKQIVDVYGGFDCDISIRRACDWDAWLRWTKNSKVLFIDKVLSIVFISDKDSLGANGPTCDVAINNANKNDRSECLLLRNFPSQKIFNDKYLDGASDVNKAFAKEMYENKKNLLLNSK